MEKKMISSDKNIVWQIAGDHGAELKKNQKLKEYTSMGVGGSVDSMLFPESVESIERIINALSSYSFPFRILGAGTNLIVGDDGLDDVIIATEKLSRSTEVKGNTVIASSGIPISRLIRNCAESGLGGLEFAEGIPGTVGGAVMMNAGSYGHWVSEFICEISYINGSGRKFSRSCSPGEFQYRKSPFHPGLFLTEVVFEFVQKERKQILGEMEAVKERRRKSQPWGVKSSGCIFKNPENEHAGRIIESAGLKGFRKGGAVVSTIHANFIVNEGNATAEDIFWLIETIKDQVFKKTGFLLEEEVVIWKR